ncbi:FAD-dependent oxidoreductase [Promicromonospora sp. NPDC060271]|uniref:FAD-dependent oxidoreductase n=1 Tax=Promicromonospora sp. NPDC060271 TaxID=3347089 RepID=UPI003668D78B
MRVIVVGAGPGGLTLANGLRQAGIEVVVYERNQQHGRSQGVSLHLEDQATTALRACLAPEQLDMMSAAVGARRDRVLSLTEQDGALVVSGSQSFENAPHLSANRRPVDRQLLRAVLLSGVSDVVRFGTALTGFEQRSDSTVRARFADGSTDTADLLVGADGIGSVVRRQYLPHVRVLDTGRCTLLGATPLSSLAGTGLPELIGDNPAKVQVTGTTMIVAAVRFTAPPPALRERWQAALRHGGVSEVEDYLMWALPTSAQHRGTDDSSEAVRRHARELTAATHPALRQVVEQARPATLARLSIGSLTATSPWTASNVTLLGDAAHAAPGFGANSAMWDAQRLNELLIEVAGGKQGLLAAIGTYEEAMRGADARPASFPGARPQGRPTGTSA